MKQDKIVFRKIWQDGIEKVFEGYRHTDPTDGRYCYKRDVALSALQWKYGVYAEFTVTDYFSVNFTTGKEAGTEEKLHAAVYDKDIKDSNTLVLLENLASGDLRGALAENTAHRLYWQLFVQNPEYNIWLPKQELQYFKDRGLIKEEKIDVSR